MSETPEQEAFDLGAFDDLKPGVVQSVKIGPNKVVGLVRTGNTVSVFNPTCPHHYASLTYGIVHNVLEAGDVGELTIDTDRWIITCPWHRWEFNLETGQALCGQSEKVRIYDSAIVEGRVITRLNPR